MECFKFNKNWKNKPFWFYTSSEDMCILSWLYQNLCFLELSTEFYYFVWLTDYKFSLLLQTVKSDVLPIFCRVVDFFICLTHIKRIKIHPDVFKFHKHKICFKCYFVSWCEYIWHWLLSHIWTWSRAPR